jgi:hypothetical protein
MPAMMNTNMILPRMRSAMSSSVFDQVVQAGQGTGQVDPSLETLHHDGDELDVEDMQIDHHAHGHFKKHRVAVVVEYGAGDVPVAADIHQQAQHHKGVPQHGGQQGRPDDRMVLVPVEDIGDGTGGESAGGQGNAGSDIDADPDAPGVLVAEIGHLADAERKRAAAKAPPMTMRRQHDHHARRQEFFFDRRRFFMGVHGVSFRVFVGLFGFFRAGWLSGSR